MWRHGMCVKRATDTGHFAFCVLRFLASSGANEGVRARQRGFGPTTALTSNVYGRFIFCAAVEMKFERRCYPSAAPCRTHINIILFYAVPIELWHAYISVVAGLAVDR